MLVILILFVFWFAQISLFMFSDADRGGGGGVMAYSVLWPLRPLQPSEEATLDLLRSTAWSGATSAGARQAFVRGLSLPCSLVGGDVGCLSPVPLPGGGVFFLPLAKLLTNVWLAAVALAIGFSAHGAR